jgi:parallel beta-helix repeat protein
MRYFIQRTVLFLTLAVLLVPLLATATAAGALSDIQTGTGADRSLTIHSVIRINNDSDLITLKASGNCTGNGTVSEPYIIEDYAVNASGEGNAIFVGNVTAYLIIRNCSLYGASSDGSLFFDGCSVTLYNCQNVSLINNTCSDSVSGVHLLSSVNNTLTNNTCIGNSDCGIFLNGSDQNDLMKNYCSDNIMDGIRLDYSDGNELTANICEGNSLYDGIYMNRSDFNTITENICTGNGHTNIYLDRSNNNSVENNICSDSITYFGIGVAASSNNTLADNICLGNGYYGIFLDMADNNTVLRNTCGDSGYSGIRTNDSVNNTISENDCSDNNDGIYLYRSSYNVISENICNDDVNYSVYLKDCSDNNQVRENICTGSDRYGIYLNLSCTGNFVIDNTCSDDRSGIHLNNSCSGNTIAENVCDSSGLYGVYLKDSDGNQVTNNTIEDSTSYGIYATGSDDNVIIGNLMTDNNGASSMRTEGHIQAFDDGTNDWNTSYGNRWSDWLTPDADENGIADNSYELDGEYVNQDFHPLSTIIKVTSHSSGAFVRDLSITISGSSVCYFGISYITWHNEATGGNGTCAGTTSWSATVPLTIEDNDITFIMTDTGGRTVSTNITIYVDVVAPSIEITSPLNGSYSNSSVLVSWNASDADSGIASAEVSSDGGNWTEAVGSSATISGLTDGNWTLYVRVTDAVGNVNSTSVNVTVDAYLPAMIILTPKNGSYNGTGSVTVTWTGDDNGTGLSHYAVSEDGTNWTTTNGTERTFSLGDGVHTVMVRAYDLVGNFNETSVTFTIDTTAPTLAISSPTNGSSVNSANVTISWVGSDATVISYYEVCIDSGNWTSLNGTNMMFNGLSDGSHNVTVRAYDLLSNHAEITSSFMIDTVAPTINITSPSNGTYVTSSSMTVRWTADDDTSVCSQLMKVDNGTWAPMPTMITSKALTGLSDGEHTIGIMVLDKAGNNATMYILVVIDTTAPTATVSPTGNSVEVNASLIITFSEMMNASSVVVQVGGSSNGSISWNGTVATFVPDELLFNSTYLVIITGTDLAGNEMVKTSTFKTVMAGSIEGVVVDDEGDPIANVLISLSNNRTALTDSNGHFLIANITHGSYNGTATVNGHALSFNVTVEAGETSDLGTLVMGSVSGEKENPYLLLAFLLPSLVVFVIVIYVLRKRKMGKDR